MRVNSIVWGIISGQVGRLVAVALRRRMPFLASAQDSARTLSAALTVGCSQLICERHPKSPRPIVSLSVSPAEPTPDLLSERRTVLVSS
jgi:hypothetical protein